MDQNVVPDSFLRRCRSTFARRSRIWFVESIGVNGAVVPGFSSPGGSNSGQLALALHQVLLGDWRGRSRRRTAKLQDHSPSGGQHDQQEYK